MGRITNGKKKKSIWNSIKKKEGMNRLVMYEGMVDT